MKRKVFGIFTAGACAAIAAFGVLTACGEGHKHSWSWTYEGDEHWQVCSGCDETQLRGAHEFGDDNICDVCGYEDSSVTPAEKYTLTLDANGGTLEVTEYEVAAGTNLAEYLNKLPEPTRGALLFGGWFNGEDMVTSSLKMPEAALTLTAKWLAPYTAQVYLQALNADKTDAIDEYEKSETVFSGYAYLGESFTLERSLEHYVQNASHADAVTTVTIEEAGNVFALYYDRATYTVTYNANVAVFVGEMAAESYKYGTIARIRTDCGFTATNYQFATWSESRDSVVVPPTTNFFIERDYDLYAVWDKGYINENDSSDVVYVSATVAMGQLGSAYRFEANGKKNGFLEENAYITGVFEFTFYVDEGEEVGRINTTLGTFCYRSEEVGTYIGFDYAYGDYILNTVLYLDGYGESVWGTMDADGGINFGNNYGVYTYDATYEDYRFSYCEIGTQNPTGDYFYFRVQPDLPDGASGTHMKGSFLVQGYESGTYLLYDLFYGELSYFYALQLDGYGNARELYVTDDGATEVLSQGAYRATDDYEDYMGEWQYFPQAEGTSYLSRFILNALTYEGETIPVYLEYDAAHAGTLISAKEGGTARLVLGGYNAAVYYPEGAQANEGVSGAYYFLGETNLTFIPYENGEAAGEMIFVIDWTPQGEYIGTFTLNEDGFLVDANGTLTGYVGTSQYLELPDRVVAVADDALSYLHTEISLKSVVIPASVETIGARAFENNYTLSRAVFLSETPIAIDWSNTVDPFRWPRGDFLIIVPDGCEEVYRSAWANCPHKITSLSELANRPEWEIENGVLISYNNKSDDPQDLDLKIPDEVVEISARVFFALDYIRSIDLNNVKKLGANALAQCTGLVSVTAPNLKEVGAGAFSLCIALKEVSLPAAVTLGDEAFASCYALTQASFGANLTSIGDRAFAYAATEVDGTLIFLVLEGTTPPAIGSDAFYGCYGRRISVDTVDTALGFYGASGWNSYALSLWVRACAEGELAGNWADLASLQPLVLNGRAEVLGMDVWLYRVNGSVITFYVYGNGSYTTLSATYANGAIDLTYNATGFRFVRTDAPITYQNGSETLVVDLSDVDYNSYPAYAKATLNGQSVTLAITGSTVKANGVIIDGVKNDLTFKLSLARTFTYTKSVNDSKGPYTAADGSFITIWFEGRNTYVTGQLMNLDGRKTPEIQTHGTWYVYAKTENSYTFSYSWLSDRYNITVTIVDASFFYSWQVGTTQQVLKGEAGAVVVTRNANGEIDRLHLMLPATVGGANEEVECTYVLQEDGSYLFYVEFDVEIYDEENNRVYYEPSPLNGTYQVTLDFDGETCTIVKLV